MGKAMLSKFLIQFSVDGWGCVPSLFFDLRPNYGGGNEDNGDLFLKVPCMLHSVTPALQQATANPTSQLETPGHSQASLGQSLVGSQLLFPGSWGAQGFVCILQESVSPVMCKSCNLQNLNPNGLQSQISWGFSPFARSPGWETCCGS